ncbi:MAG TPA: ThuA domain-containing protein [Chloroflexota bacterium]|nr:ThuA domain-containing protein [Chloroflexota bacterium]
MSSEVDVSPAAPEDDRTRRMLTVTVWGEYVHERQMENVRAIYPRGMHETIAAGLRTHLDGRVTVRTATLQEPEHGLTEDVLAGTDVLSWWGHAAHDQVSDEVVERVLRHVLAGMGLLVLHSGHESKIFRRLMGTTCSLRWREAAEREVVWTVNPAHPIAAGVPEAFIIPHQEMYGELFDIPQPDELVFISSFAGGEVFRSGCCFARGRGRIFYFSPGHETYPVYERAEVQRVLANAVLWAYNPGRRAKPPRSVNSPMGWFERLNGAG